MSVLEVKDLSIALPAGRSERPILSDVSLHVGEGETVGLVGESGSGKSVTSRSALGLLPPGAVTSGQVRVMGSDVLTMNAKELRAHRSSTASMVFQDPTASINPMRRLGDFLTEGARVTLGMSKQAAEAKAIELLEAVGIRNPRSALRSHPHQFSGGMLQRVMIAAALLPDPRLILADEPTTALDVTTQAEVVSILLRLARERRVGLLFVTHNLELAAAVCDRIYVMYAGQVVETQTADNLFTSPRHPYTAGLLASTPTLAGQGRLDAIPGRPLSLSEAPGGCLFAPRCSFVQPECEQSRPPLRTVEPGVQAACRRSPEIAPALQELVTKASDSRGEAS
jgi:oligopeptide/dipeptide ABC transporter ATP-binding protein